MKTKIVGTSEASRIADQLRRAFEGSAWHGPAVLELLEDVDAGRAAARPLKSVHSIWELVLHIAAWDRAALVRLDGEKCQPRGAENFPPVANVTEAAWRKAVAGAKRTHDDLVKTVALLPDSRLRDHVPGKRYDFYHMLHGIAQHELYHAGQICDFDESPSVRVTSLTGLVPRLPPLPGLRFDVTSAEVLARGMRGRVALATAGETPALPLPENYCYRGHDQYEAR